MALIDTNPEFVAQACRKIRSYLEDIRASVEVHPEGPVVSFDFDAIGQLLTPHSRKSQYAGLLWHSVLTAQELGDVDISSRQAQQTGALSLHPTKRVQIPAGAKQELRYFCRKLLRDYTKLVEGQSAQKLGIAPDDWEKLLSEDQLSDDELGTLVRKVGEINLSLSLLSRLLDNYAEFSRLASPGKEDIRFQDYLMRIDMQRPQFDKTQNNSNDALNLAQTSDLRSKGYEAYLVTTTRAVLDSDDRYSREPFYFGLELAVRKSLRNISGPAANNRLSLLISRLTQVIVNIQQYGDLVSASNKAPRPDLPIEVALVRQALSKLGEDPILKEISALLSEAASAVRSASEGTQLPKPDGGSIPAEIITFNKFRSVVNRLRSNLGDIPRVSLKKRTLSSDHFSYSLLDQEGKLLFAADLHSDDLAIAWATEVTMPEFCQAVRAYYSGTRMPKTITALVRLSGSSIPITIPIVSLSRLAETVMNHLGDLKLALLKVLCDENIFWFDTSTLYAFEHPEDTRHFEDAKVAVSIAHKDELTMLTDLFLTTTTNVCSRVEAQNNLKKLFSMEGR